MSAAMGAARPSRRRLLHVALIAALLGALLGALLPALAASPAAAAWSTPGLVRSISGNGRPGVFPWGIQYNPVSDEILVGDYLNYQIRRYATDGRVLGSFFRADNTGQPYSIAVDPRNGDIYVPEIADGSPGNKVARYSQTGNFLSTLSLSGIDYHAWITIDEAGNLWQSDSHYGNNGTNNPPAIRKWRLSDGRQVASWNVTPAGKPTPRMYGIDVDAAGNVWATDTINKAVYKWSSTGALLATYTDTVHFTGDLREITVDDTHGWFYVTDAGANQVEKYDIAGTHLATIGGTGDKLGKFQAPRQTTVDDTGQLYVAEYGNARVSVVDSDGAVLSFFPDPAQPAPAGQLGQPRDVDVDPVTGEVWVADSWNQRVQRFSADGAFLGTWGNRGGSPPYGMNYPRGVAIDPDSRNVWVVNQRGHHIKRYTPDMDYLDTLGDGQTDSSAPGFFRWPLDVEFSNGLAFVSDRNSGRIKVLDAASGTESRQWARTNHGLAVDPATGNVYVTDPSNNRIYVYTSTGAQLFSFGSTGSGDGQFRHAWDAVVSGDTLYVTDDTLSRVAAFGLDGTWLGSFGGFGSGPYQFRNPSGIAADGVGRLYVADAGNDRIQVFDTTVARGGGSWPPPSTTISAPGSGAQLPGAPIRITGTATDNSAVATVEVAVQDSSTGLWYNAGNSTWQSTKSYAIAPWTGATPSRSVAFAWTFIGEEYGHSYFIEARSTDVSNNVGPSVTRTVTVLPKSTEDTQDPDTAITFPQPGELVRTDGPVTLAGTASDDLNVTAVDVAITRGGNEWWQPGGGWGPFAWLDATVDAPGTTSTGWFHRWEAPANGSYSVTARARDESGRADGQRPLIPFEVGAALPPDTTAPDSSVSAPTPDQSVPLESVTFAGTATDDRAVAGVKVAVKDNATGQWWQPSGGWGGGFASFSATLVAAGQASTGWSYEWTPPGAGSYGLSVVTTDASGNLDTTQPFVRFTVRSSADSVPANGTVSDPTPNATLPLGPLTFGGPATDDAGVGAVKVSIKNTADNTWLRSDGTWGAFAVLDAHLAAPGTPSTMWSFSWTPATTGNYALQVRADDTSGNSDPTKPWVLFSVVP